jgi:uncharacterized membrane protein
MIFKLDFFESSEDLKSIAFSCITIAFLLIYGIFFKANFNEISQLLQISLIAVIVVFMILGVLFIFLSYIIDKKLKEGAPLGESN